MKRYLVPVLIVSFVGLSAAVADDSHHPEKEKASGEAPAVSGKSTGMGMMDMDGMQQRMKEMQQTMAQIQKTDDPVKRQQLMQEHMQQMHEMMGSGMMQGGSEGMMGSGMMGDAGKNKDMPMPDRQQMMEKRMDMMQGMMEQMMEQMMAQQGGAKPGKQDGKAAKERDHKDKK
ncbi:MAG: hypothetical protein FD120_1490 [Gammaproteobacteria bacterium]|nr:MAG: hypothetical protein FD120_1490 [Gammaproteobacteria bacterium]